MKLDILAIGVHPDDVELGCSGTLVKEIKKGKQVGVLDLTRGELGTRGSAETRDKEAAEAAKILGLSIRENLRFEDGFLINNREHQLEIVKKIRHYQPDMVLCNAIKDRHIDHGKASKLTSDACFLSGLLKLKTTVNGKEQTFWRPKWVYHYIQWLPIKPDIVVDITAEMPTKLKAVMAYKTQFFNPDSTEPETPISSKNFTESIVYRAKDLGRIIGVDYAEGFTAERYIGTDSLYNLK